MATAATYQAILDAIDAAIPKVILQPQTITFADGKGQTFRTADELLQTRKHYQALLNQAEQTAGDADIVYGDVSI